MFTRVLWPELIAQWELAPAEAAYVDRQQGLHCEDCGAALRCWTLAAAVMRNYGFRGLLKDFVATPQARELRVLEINEAGGLSRYLAMLPRRELADYPHIDLMQLPHRDDAFDLVVHSDTLEHVADPGRALRECRRVLAPHGICAFTVPVIVGRLTRSRAGLEPSYHGPPTDHGAFLVHHEFGADLWASVLAAGFAECRVVSLESPSAHAWIAVRD